MGRRNRKAPRVRAPPGQVLRQSLLQYVLHRYFASRSTQCSATKNLLLKDDPQMTATRSTHSEFCHYTFSDNRRCRMLRQTNHPTLCPFHARDEQHSSNLTPSAHKSPPPTP